MNGRNILTGVLMFALLGLTGRALFGEYVFTKDGAIKEGSIIAENKASITLKGKDNRREVIPRENIMRLLYTNLYMGKVYVQRRDGKNFEAYMVDEDQNTYTFRKELYQPKEMSVNRLDVLFMSQMNPSGLKGTPETREVRLEWFPPYNEIRHYIIYKMKKGDKEFAKAGTTRRTRFIVEELASNTTFLFKVTALDRTDTESLPSNEITVTTKNIRPERPENIRLELRDGEKAGTDKKGKAASQAEKRQLLAWNESRDSDGSIKEYRVYRRRDDKTELAATVRTPSFEIPAGVRSDDLRIRAVDDRGDESDEAVVRIESWLHLRAGVIVSYPFKTLDELVGYGYGGSIGIYCTGIFFENLAFGVDAGYVYWTSDRDLLDAMHMAPVSVWMGLRFRPFEWLALMPALHAGAAGLYSTYRSLGKDGDEAMADRTKTGCDFIVGGSLAIEYDLTGRYFLFVKGEYTLMLETEEHQPYAAATAGAGMRL